MKLVGSTMSRLEDNLPSRSMADTTSEQHVNVFKQELGELKGT